VFNVKLSVTDTSLTTADVEAIKKGMQAIFADAGQKLVFDDPSAAIGTYNGTYSLTISPRLPPQDEEVNAFPGFEVFGVVNGITLTSDRTDTFSDKKGHMINRGVVSTYWTGKALRQDQSLIDALAETGAHETGHWFLRQYGHRSNDKSIMGPGTLGNRPSTRDAAKLSRLWVIAPLVTRVVCSHPQSNAWIAKDADKSDRIDAYKLADLLRLNRFKEVHYRAAQRRRDFKTLAQAVVLAQQLERRAFVP
jgi:hypothetical protein